MVRTPLSLRLLLSTLVLAVGLTGLSTAAAGQDDQSGDISVSIERRLAAPGATTDLGLLRTRAEPNDDGSYRISGNKIFITSAHFARWH